MKVHQCFEMRVANGPADRGEVVVESANIKGAIEGFFGGISDCAINKKYFLIDPCIFGDVDHSWGVW